MRMHDKTYLIGSKRRRLETALCNRVQSHRNPSQRIVTDTSWQLTNSKSASATNVNCIPLQGDLCIENDRQNIRRSDIPHLL